MELLVGGAPTEADGDFVVALEAVPVVAAGMSADPITNPGRGVEHGGDVGAAGGFDV